MTRKRVFLGTAMALALAAISLTAAAGAMVMKMGLGDLVGNADKVFRGTVLTKEPGTVAAGGAELSTVTYTVQVDEALKGDFGKPVVSITMLGNLKADVASGNVQRLSRMDMNPDLSIGGEYVLFTTAPSAVGLSTTVGLGQGVFRVFANADGRDLVANELDNHGLFAGPVQYSELAAAVAELLGK